MIRPAIVAVGVLAILSLAGCAPAATTTRPPTAHAHQTPTPTPTPTPSPDALPAISDLVVTPTGLGGLVVGKPVADTGSASSLVVWNPTQCATHGAWVPNYPDSPGLDQLVDVPFVVGTVAKGDPISFIRIVSTEISTDRGIHVGSTAAQLAAAYPTFDQTVAEGDLGDLYSISGGQSQLVFEFVKHAQNPIDDGTVVQIEVESGTGTPIGAAGTDGFSYCA